MHRRGPIDRAVWLLASLAAALAAALLVASPALADRAFAPRFSVNDTGNITIAANALLTCPDSAPNCATAQASPPIVANRAEAALNNNNYNMVEVNAAPGTVDRAPSFNSSTSDVTLPPGATILFAGLYWGADTSAGSNVGDGPRPAAAPNASLRNQVGLRVPGASGYTTVTASQLDVSSNRATRYAGFANVTELASAAGAGTYAVANVQTGTGSDRQAGWALVVVYHDSADPPRNLTVTDGYLFVQQAQPATEIPISGFQAPTSGPVDTTLGFVAYDGDSGAFGDYAALNGTRLTDALSPVNNFFGSVVTSDGVNDATRDPDHLNNFGYDTKLVNADGLIPNGATAATITTGTTNENYYPQVITLATNLYSPVIDARKAVANVTNPGGPTRPGDVLRYTVSYRNTGLDPATNFAIRDTIPAGTRYVPGSLAVRSGNGAPARLSDAPGDDRAEFDSSGNAVAFRAGAGATAIVGGVIAPGRSYSATFEVTVDGADSDGQQIVNQATASYIGQTLGTGYTNQTATVTSTVSAPNLTVFKSHAGVFVSGGPVPFTLTVSNIGGSATDGSPVTVTDRLPRDAFSRVESARGDGWRCDVAGLTVSCMRTGALAAGASFPMIFVDAIVAPTAPLQICNTATVAGGGDSIAADNSSSDCGPGSRLADLTIAKAAQPGTVYDGDTVTFTLTVSNRGPSPARRVVVDDPLSAVDYGAVRATATRGSCTTAVRCSLGALPAFGTARVTITATVHAHATTLRNAATVSSATPDPVSDNNRAAAAVIAPPSANLAVAKAGPALVSDSRAITGIDAANPRAGATHAYTVTVANHGPDTAERVVVYDALPQQFTATSISAPGFRCTVGRGAGAILICTRARLAADSRPRHIVVAGRLVAQPGVAERAVNAVSVSSATGDPDLAGNAAAVIAPIEPQANLAIVKRALLADDATPVNEPLSRGDAFYYELTVTNFGPSPALHDTVTDTLPAGITYDPTLPQRSHTPALPSACTVSGGVTITCSYSSLAQGSVTRIEIPVGVAPDADSGPHVNAATVASATTPDPDPTDNSAGVSVWVGVASDLTVAKRVTPAVATAPRIVTFTLEAINNGPHPTAALITDVLPRTLTFVSASGSCSRSGQTVTCGPLRIGSQGAAPPVVIRARVNDRAAGTKIVNSATIASVNGGVGHPQLRDFDPFNNAANQPLVVDPAADLSLRKSASTRRPEAGAQFSYRLTVHNAGPNAASAVKVTDRIPPGVAFSSAPRDCLNTGTVTCTVDHLAPGASASFALQVHALGGPLGRRLTNTARVSSADPDPFAGNNAASATVRIRANAGGRGSRPGECPLSRSRTLPGGQPVGVIAC